jgi:hypothetical protein
MFSAMRGGVATPQMQSTTSHQILTAPSQVSRARAAAPSGMIDWDQPFLEAQYATEQNSRLQPVRSRAKCCRTRPSRTGQERHLTEHSADRPLSGAAFGAFDHQWSSDRSNSRSGSSRSCVKFVNPPNVEISVSKLIELNVIIQRAGPPIRHPSRRFRAIPSDNLLGQIDEGAQAGGHVAASWIIQAISRKGGRPLA